MKSKKIWLSLGIGLILGIIVSLLMIFIIHAFSLLFTSFQFFMACVVAFLIPYCVLVIRSEKINNYVTIVAIIIVSCCITSLYCMTSISSTSIISPILTMTFVLHIIAMLSLLLHVAIKSIKKK